MREQFLCILDPDWLRLVIHFVCKYCVLTLVLGLPFATHTSRQPDRPWLAFCEFITGVFVQLLLCEPHSLFFIHPLTWHFVPAQVRDWDDLLGTAIMFTLVTFDHFKHCFCHFIAACIYAYIFNAGVDCLLGGRDQVCILFILTKCEWVGCNVPVVIDALLQVADVAFLVH